MAELKLLDIDSPLSTQHGVDNLGVIVDEISDIPINVLVSPTQTTGVKSPHSDSDREETSFIQREKLRAFDDVSGGRVSSPSPSGGYSSSGREELSSPRNFPEPSNRRINKVGDLDQQPSSSRLMFMEKGKRRRSGGETSRETDVPRSLTSMSDYLSDHHSYKDRLKDHFNSVRERALESVSRPQSRSQSRMRLLLASRPSRAEDALKREERDVSVALERHQKLRGQWRQLSVEVLRRKTEKEGCDFFIQDTERPESASPEPAIAPASPTSSVGSGEAKVTAADCLGIKEDWEPVIWSSAKVPTYTDSSKSKLKEILFCPSAKKVPIEKKLEEGLEPRFLEDEGLYVGSPGHRPRRMRAKLEQRLLRAHDGRKWFGPDGELLSRASPLEFDSEIHTSTCTEERTEYKYPKLPSMETGLSDLDIVLDIELISVHFTHHSLFSREHVVEQRLRDIWRRHRELRQLDGPRRLRGQLDALRRARDMDDAGDAERLFKDIHDTRKRWFAELLLEKQVEARLLSCWKDLEKLREEQGFRNTTVQLVISQKSAVSAQAWERELANVVAEAQEDVRREIEARRAKEEKEEEREELLQHETSESGDDIVEAPRQRLAQLDEAAVAQEVSERYRAVTRSPGEPLLELSLDDLGPPTSTSSDAREEARRSAVKQQEIFAKLLYNGKEICRSHKRFFSQSFSIKFGERFAVRLLERPRNLSLELVQSGDLIYQLYLPFPEGLATVANSDIEVHQFSSATVISHNHAGVGCGRDIVPCPGGSVDNCKPVCLHTSGTVNCRLGWAVDADGRILAPTKHFWRTVRKEKLKREAALKPQLDLKKLREWAELAKLDPNDPDNAALFDWLTESENKPPVTGASPNELDFCDSSVIDNNPRLKLLRLRDQGEPEFRGCTMVPLAEKLIPPDVFKAYEARVAKPVEPEIILDPLDSHRVWGRRRLEQVRQQVVQQCRQSRQHRRLEDIVTEDQVPDFGTLGLTLMRWLRPKRPLRPERKQRKKVPVQSLIGQDVNIIVNVVRAFEVPVRKDVDTLSGNGSIEGFSLVNVRPFVSATFRGACVRTTAAEGANPTWNQDLVLPIRSSSGDFSPGVLASMRDTLFLHLFDEVIVDLVEEDGLRDTTIHQRLERHWLASLEIPFSTLYCNTRVEGTFQLYSPPVLLGYEREAHRITVAGLLPQRDATYLTLFITVQPAVNPPEPIQDIFTTTETPALERHLRGWTSEVSTLFPARKIRPLVSTSSGASVCVTRLIRPLAPPALGPEPTTSAAVARFVARIPTIASAALFPGMLDVRLTCDQVLSMLSGDVEDHAVLLCCFLLHMGLPAYLLLGVGIPHGAAAYVLVNTTGSETIWDPTSGKKCSVRDSFCPLQKVYCLVNDTNIWANIQEDESPRRVRFDVSKRGDWLPAFNKNMSAPADSIQPDILEFKATSKQAVMGLQDKLERSLRDGVMRWRRRHRTQWNRYCAATMRKLLPDLEEATWEVKEAPSPDHWQRLNDILASHKVCGFPINMAYTDMEAVMEAVKATGVHTNESEDAEFALAVYIYPYPCDVLSVWIYVASLSRRR